MRRLLFVLFLMVSISVVGYADPITLTLSGPIVGNTVGPQSTSNPCIIAGTTCQQPASMGYNNFQQSGSISVYDAFSTTPTAQLANGTPGTPYTVSQLTGAIGSNSFVIAIDVNTTGAASERLLMFDVIIDGIVAYTFNETVNIGNVNNNGNGFADYTLGTVSLAGLPSTSTVLFHAKWDAAVDGAESFFLVGSPTSIPESSSLTMLLSGIGLISANFLRRKFVLSRKD